MISRIYQGESNVFRWVSAERTAREAAAIVRMICAYLDSGPCLFELSLGAFGNLRLNLSLPSKRVAIVPKFETAN